MTEAIVGIFIIVYLGMIVGALPFLQLDRTGIALLGAIALLAIGAVSPEEAANSIHLPTVILLFAFMVVSAQLRLGGFYDRVTRELASLPLTPPLLLGALIFCVAVLSAAFSNDIICLAVAPVLVDACRRRHLDPLPFLLALACAANIGSAATLIGNPQNMLIGATLHLSFGGYLAWALPPVLAALLVAWALILVQNRGRLVAKAEMKAGIKAGMKVAMKAGPPDEPPGVPFDRWQTAKGLAVALVIVLCFLFTSLPREVVALTGAGILLTSRKLHSSSVLGLIDWGLLVLFAGLFIVNHALQATGIPARLVADLASTGIVLGDPAPLFATSFVLSNIVSNVPAVMLLLPSATHPPGGFVLALASTLAGNLLIVGSIANIIVIEAAAAHGIRIDARIHARVGVPVTIATLAIAAAWLAYR